jgi:hypothetical protein
MLSVESVESDSESLDEFSVELAVEMSVVESLDELSVESDDTLLDESVVVPAGELSVNASAAPPLKSPARITANTANCFFTASSFRG